MAMKVHGKGGGGERRGGHEKPRCSTTSFEIDIAGNDSGFSGEAVVKGRLQLSSLVIPRFRCIVFIFVSSNVLDSIEK